MQEVEIRARVEAVWERLARATARPWATQEWPEYTANIEIRAGAGKEWLLAEVYDEIDEEHTIDPKPNAELIAHAPDDLTELLKIVQQLQSECLDLRDRSTARLGQAGKEHSRWNPGFTARNYPLHEPGLHTFGANWDGDAQDMNDVANVVRNLGEFMDNYAAQEKRIAELEQGAAAHIDQIRALIKQCDDLHAALVWASGADVYLPKGAKRKEWESIVAPLLNPEAKAND